MLKPKTKAIARQIPIIDRLFRHKEDKDLIARWAKGIKFERDLWENWLRTKGAQWPEDYQSKLDPECPLDAGLDFVFRSFPNLPDRYRILDVGAGPLTLIGKKMAGAELEITAVDPL